jgi:hypothetical protein
LRFEHGVVETLDLDRCTPVVMPQIRVSCAEALEGAGWVRLGGPLETAGYEILI